MISSDALFASEITLLVGFASAAIILVLTATFGMDSAKDIRALKALLISQNKLELEEPHLDSPSVAVRQKGKLSRVEARHHVILAGFSALFISLLVAILLCSLNGDTALVWRLSAVITVLLHLNGTFRLIAFTRRNHQFSLSRIGMIGAGFVISGGNSVAAFGFWPEAAPFFVMIGIFWTLIVASVSFMTLLGDLESE
jgi:hypothetical protein